MSGRNKRGAVSGPEESCLGFVLQRVLGVFRLRGWGAFLGRGLPDAFTESVLLWFCCRIDGYVRLSGALVLD
jgi:hypothetical protein